MNVYGTNFMLMYVVSTQGYSVTLKEIGSCVGVDLKLNLPSDIVKNLVGRHVWATGDLGGTCEIHSWVELPKSPMISKGEEK